MWDAEERRKYMELNKIDPYTVLDCKKTDSLKTVKKKYHKLALTLHPDKSKGKSDLEFKILKECYMYIKDDLEIITVDNSEPLTLQELRDQRNEKFVYQEDRNVFTTNFEDPEIRKQLFPQDTVPFGKAEETCRETNYSNIAVPIPKNIFGKKKFNLKYFNEVFEAKKKLNNQEITVFKEPQVLPCQSSLVVGSIAKYAGVIMENSNQDYEENFQKFKRNEENIDDIPLSKIKKVVKAMKKESKDQKFEDVETLFKIKKSQGVPEIRNRISMAEAEENLRKINLQNTRDLLKRNKEYIKEKLHVYPENFRKNLEF